MERMTIKEFKDQSNIEIIESIMKMNNGYVTSKELSNFGIHRMYLNIMKEKGMIEKVGNGIYIDSSKIEDNYFVFDVYEKELACLVIRFYYDSFAWWPGCWRN